jgi:alpha-ribazole phosphatase/probable phosphoglycerate mutase
MMRLIFVRHAETDMAGRFCGHSNPELNERGRAQLPGLSEKLEGNEFRKIFTSDLARARQTAEAIAAHFGIEVSERPGLREIYFGDWEGLSWREIEARDPVAAKRWINGYPHVPAPGGESFLDFQARARHESCFLRQQALQWPILVVTHAGFLRVALPIFRKQKRDIRELTEEYASVTPIHDGFLPLAQTS